MTCRPQTAPPGAIRAAALAIALAAFPAHAVDPPPQMVEAAEAAFAECAARGGSANILPGYRTDADLNGDGVIDFITDLGQMECVGAWQAFCHSTGCPVTVWLSGAGGGYSRFPLGDLRSFEIAASADGDALPALVAHYDTGLCETGDVEAATCSRRWTFETNAPDIPPFDVSTASAPTPRAAPDPGSAPPPPDQPAGWTLRQVPGASPLALGSGTGRIASFSAFCLQDAPFIAVRFSDAPEAEELTLGFAFSQGALEVRAIREPTAGGAYVIDLAGQPLAARLAGRDSTVDLTVDGTPEGTLSLRGSTDTLRTALAGCYEF